MGVVTLRLTHTVCIHFRSSWSNSTGHTCLPTSDKVPSLMLASDLELHLTEELVASTDAISHQHALQSCFLVPLRNLQRYMHYNSRWEAHVASQKLEAKQVDEIKEKIVELEDNGTELKDYTWLSQVQPNPVL